VKQAPHRLKKKKDSVDERHQRTEKKAAGERGEPPPDKKEREVKSAISGGNVAALLASRVRVCEGQRGTKEEQTNKTKRKLISGLRTSL
jgi:hypothetical protein